MMRDLADARRALGFGAVFVGYAIFLIINRWMHDRKVAQDTRARLILESSATSDRRESLRSSEGIE